MAAPRTGPDLANGPGMGMARSAQPGLVGADALDGQVPHTRRRRVGALIVTALITVGAAAGFSRLHEFVSERDLPAAAPAPTPLHSVVDRRLVTVTLTTPEWTKVHEVVTVSALRTDRRLWRQMHIGDWDRIPAEIREPALRNMITAYGPVLAGPRTWRNMTAGDWDAVPQPIRAMAFLRMVWHWSVAEKVGVDFGLQPRRMAHSIGAIVMAESWFEHRAVNVNEWGTDLGLAQCSTFCQRIVAAMGLTGMIRFVPSEADYFNPWVATRIATIWFKRELIRAEGDVNLAIRAYHRGIDDAMDEKGDVYLARVLRLREQYIREQTASATWRFLARTIAPI